MKRFLKWFIGVIITIVVALGIVWFIDRDIITNVFNENVIETVEDTVESTSESIEEAVDSLATKVDSLVNQSK